MLIWGLPFRVGKIIWSLKFRGPKCAICGLKFGAGEIIWVMKFSSMSLYKSLSLYCIKFFFETGQLITSGLRKS